MGGGRPCKFAWPGYALRGRTRMGLMRVTCIVLVFSPCVNCNLCLEVVLDKCDGFLVGWRLEGIGASVWSFVFNLRKFTFVGSWNVFTCSWVCALRSFGDVSVDLRLFFLFSQPSVSPWYPLGHAHDTAGVSLTSTVSTSRISGCAGSNRLLHPSPFERPWRLNMYFSYPFIVVTFFLLILWPILENTMSSVYVFY